MIYIGVDPGKSGGFAIISQAQPVACKQVYSWDSTAFAIRMRLVLKAKIEIIACVEKVGARPGQGTVSMFNFGKEAGYIEGILTALEIPYQLVPPATWKREFGLIGKDKKASIEVCKRLFPGVDLRPTGRCRVESDGMAEALLMAEYARRQM